MADSAEWWDRRAVAYDSLAWVRDRRLLSWQASRIGDVMRSLPGDARALDIGCGTGALTSLLLSCADRAGVRLSVDAIDASAAMVDRARGRVRHGATFRACADQDWHRSGYDIVAARMVLHHLPSLSVLARWLGRLTPGGHVVVIDGPYPHVSTSHAASDLYQRIMQAKEPGRLCFTAAEVAQVMLDAGAADVTVHETWGPAHSVANWLDGNGAAWVSEPWRRAFILAQLERASDAVRDYLRITGEGENMTMRWRQCVVAGRKG